MNSFCMMIQKFGPDIISKSRQHMFLTFMAMIIACSIALPVGILLTRCRRRIVTSFVLGLVNIIQPLPSLAFVALVSVLFRFLQQTFHLKLPTIGLLPGLVALVVYALLPILRNTYTGIKQVDPAIIEVATGMGMKKNQVLFSVELPLALPVIMAGIRTSTVWTIGVAALVSLVGAGGLGDLIFQGLSNYRVDLILAGAVPAALLALVFDWLLALMEQWFKPGGITKKRG